MLFFIPPKSSSIICNTFRIYEQYNSCTRNVWKNIEVCLSLFKPSVFKIMSLLVDKTISFEEVETVGSYAVRK